MVFAEIGQQDTAAAGQRLGVLLHALQLGQLHLRIVALLLLDNIAEEIDIGEAVEE